jgi:hypothetical protein
MRVDVVIATWDTLAPVAAKFTLVLRPELFRKRRSPDFCESADFDVTTSGL